MEPVSRGRGRCGTLIGCPGSTGEVQNAVGEVLWRSESSGHTTDTSAYAVESAPAIIALALITHTNWVSG